LNGYSEREQLLGSHPIETLVMTVNDAFSYRKYGGEKEPNSTEDSKPKDGFEDKLVKRCSTETDKTRTAEGVNNKHS